MAPADPSGRLHVSVAHHRQFWKRVAAVVSETLEFAEFELLMRRKNGSAFPSEQRLTPIRDAAGQISNWVYIVRDLTSRKESEHQFRAHLLGLKSKLNSYQGPNYSGDALDQAGQLIDQEHFGPQRGHHPRLPRGAGRGRAAHGDDHHHSRGP